MQIDWLTVTAQLANFLVLLWLLQRFLYRPITHAMARREARIEDRLSEAKARLDAAQAQKDALEDARMALDRSRDQRLEEAREEAGALKARLEDDLRAEMERKRDTWRKELESERAAFSRALQKRAGHQAIEIARKMLRDYANGDLTEQVAEVFIGQLKALDEEARRRLSDAAAHASGPALVESDFPLSAAVRRTLTRAIHASIAENLNVGYREDDDILLGFRLTIGEQTAEWSAGHHLKILETTLDEVLEATQPAPAS